MTTRKTFKDNNYSNHDYSPWRPSWLPPVEVSNGHQLPLLTSRDLSEKPLYTTSFIRSDDCANHGSSLLHGYVDDARLNAISKNPSRYLQKFATHLATITPDFSVKIGMPIQDRIRSIFMGRAIGAFLEYHGLAVVPNIRWAERSDLDFVCEGLGQNGTIALSTQGLLSDKVLLNNFESGLPKILEILKPCQIILYGTATSNFYNLVADCHVIEFPTDRHRVHLLGRQ